MTSSTSIRILKSGPRSCKKTHSPLYLFSFFGTMVVTVYENRYKGDFLCCRNFLNTFSKAWRACWEFPSTSSGADGLAVLNLILPVYGLIYAIGAMIGIGSATRYAIDRAQGKSASFYFLSAVTWDILISIPLVLAGIFIPDKILQLLGADAVSPRYSGCLAVFYVQLRIHGVCTQ